LIRTCERPDEWPIAELQLVHDLEIDDPGQAGNSCSAPGASASLSRWRWLNWLQVRVDQGILMSTSVAKWLQQLGLGKYAEAFAEHAIDEEVLPTSQTLISLNSDSSSVIGKSC
jgi:hypothetical protein